MKKKRIKTNAQSASAKDLRSRYLSYPKAAQRLGVGLSTIRTLVKAGTLETFTYGPGMHPMIEIASIEKLLAKREAK